MRCGSLNYITGVDRLFLAPELIKNRLGPKSDVWSIGAILYLLITGGVNDKRHEEVFDFHENIWFNVSEEMKDFMLKLLVVSPSERASVD